MQENDLPLGVVEQPGRELYVSREGGGGGAPTRRRNAELKRSPTVSIVIIFTIYKYVAFLKTAVSVDACVCVHVYVRSYMINTNINKYIYIYIYKKHYI